MQYIPEIIHIAGILLCFAMVHNGCFYPYPSGLLHWYWDHSPSAGETTLKTLDIKNNAWVTVDNDFLVTSGVICQRFSRVTKSRVKIIGKSPHEWPKIVIHGNECIILFLTRYFISRAHSSATNNHRSLISLRTVFSDLTLWRHHSWSVTSRECEALALWRHIRRLFLHVQIGAKAIFTSE